jgi:hypothetical protein
VARVEATRKALAKKMGVEYVKKKVRSAEELKRDKANARRRARYKKNKAQRNAARRAHYQKNKERINAKRRANYSQRSNQDTISYHNPEK